MISNCETRFVVAQASLTSSPIDLTCVVARQVRIAERDAHGGGFGPHAVAVAVNGDERLARDRVPEGLHLGAPAAPRAADRGFDGGQHRGRCAEIKVQVRQAARGGVAGQADALAALDGLPDRDEGAREVDVAGGDEGWA